LRAKKKHPIAVMISGGGTNLQSIIDSCEKGAIPCEVVLVISNRENAFGLTRAKNHGIKGVFLDHREFPSREAFEERLISLIEESGAELVCLAGFMRVLTPLFVNHFRGRLMNIHPALLPSFPGTHGQKQALDYGVRFSGATVHFVDEGTDTGPIIVQAVVPVYEDDTEDSLGARILTQEHKIYPFAIRCFFENRLEIRGRKVFLKESRGPQPFAHINPEG